MKQQIVLGREIGEELSLLASDSEASAKGKFFMCTKNDNGQYAFFKNKVIMKKSFLHLESFSVCLFAFMCFHDTDQMSHVMRKLDFCLWENKGTDQLRSNCEADQRLCFHYTDSTIPLLLTLVIFPLKRTP